MKKKDLLVYKIGCSVMLKKLAKEAAELSNASLQLANILQEETPSDASEGEINEQIMTKYTNIVQCVKDLCDARLLEYAECSKEKQVEEEPECEMEDEGEMEDDSSDYIASLLGAYVIKHSFAFMDGSDDFAKSHICKPMAKTTILQTKGEKEASYVLGRLGKATIKSSSEEEDCDQECDDIPEFSECCFLIPLSYLVK